MPRIARHPVHMGRAQLLAALMAAVERGGHHHHLSWNANKLAHVRTDPTFRALADRADTLAADGASIRWVARAHGQPVPERIPGVELASELLDRAAEHGWRVFLYGARPEVLATVVRRCRAQGVPVVGACDGFAHAPDAVAAFIERARPQLLLVALGTPRSERFIDRWRPDAVCLGVGGTFDVLAGAVPRAPTWTHAVGLEGAYRVAMEPRKRWRVAWSGARAVFDALAHPGP